MRYQVTPPTHVLLSKYQSSYQRWYKYQRWYPFPLLNPSKVYSKFLREMEAVEPLEGPHTMVTPMCRLSSKEDEREEEGEVEG